MTHSTTIQVPTDGGTIPTRVLRPDGRGPWPALLFYMDGAGVRPTLEAMAARAAALGYVVALPELYWRAGAYAPFVPAAMWTDPAERARGMKLIAEVTPERAVSDTRAVLDALARESDVARSKVGTFGYCLGGRLSLLAACSFPDRVAAAMSVHGGHLATDDPSSPHRLAARIRARVHVAAAETDPSFSPEQRERLRGALEASGIEHTIEVHPGTKHGFAVPDLPVYDRDAAETHWERLASFFASMRPSAA